MALDCVPYVGINRTDIQCTRLHTRGSGEVMKKSISLLLISCITISYVIGCYGTVLLILVPSLSVHLIYPYFLLCCSSFTLSFCSSSPPPLPTWAFLFAILFLVFCPMNKIQAPGRSRASWSSVSTGQANKSFLWFLPPARLDLLHLNARADIVVPCQCTLWVAVLARGGSCTHAALRSVST